MKIALIGSGGYIGSRFSAFLKNEGALVLKYSSSDGTGIDPVSGLLPHGFKIPEGTDSVVYLAQSPHYRDVPQMGWHLMAVNVLSALRAAEAARRAGVSRFIYASTGNVYAKTLGPLAETSKLCRDNWYSLSKVQAEEALALFRGDMDVIITRLFGVYGPGQTNKLVPGLLDSVLRGRSISIDKDPSDDNDTGGLRISLCYIDDIMRILMRLIKEGGPRCLNVAGDKAVSIGEIASIMARCLNKEASFRATGKNIPFNLVADIRQLKEALNPTFTSIDEGIRKTVEFETSKSSGGLDV